MDTITRVLREHERSPKTSKAVHLHNTSVICFCNLHQLFDRSIGQIWAITTPEQALEVEQRLIDAGHYVEYVIKLHKLSITVKTLSTMNLMLPGTVEAAAGATVRLSCEVLCARFVVLWILKENNILYSISLTDTGYRPAAVSMRVGQGIAGRCAAERMPIRIDDFSDYQHILPTGTPAPHHPRVLQRYGVQSAQFLPIIQNGRLVGVIAAYYDRAYGATDVDKDILTIFAHEFAVCYEPLVKSEEDNAFRKAIEERAPLIHTALTIANQLHDVNDALLIAESNLGMVTAKEGEEFLEIASDRINTAKRIINTAVQQVRAIQPETPAQSTKSRSLSPSWYHRIGRQDLAGFLEDIANQHRQTAREHRTEIITYTTPLRRNIYFNSFQMQRAISNIITNAIQSVQSRGRKRITIRAAETDRGVEISISDTGPGIQAQHLPRVFDMFFTTRGREGSGLGLAIAKQIVEAHGGSITVASYFGEGATFTITLPSGEG